MTGCPCEGLEGEKLVRCLAPPRGEYEVHVDLPGGSVAVVNEEGFFIRSLHHEEALPFLQTVERRYPLKHILDRARLTVDDLLCLTVRALEEAAAHGSLKAARKLGDCKELVEKIRKRCGA